MGKVMLIYKRDLEEINSRSTSFSRMTEYLGNMARSSKRSDIYILAQRCRSDFPEATFEKPFTITKYFEALEGLGLGSLHRGKFTWSQGNAKLINLIMKADSLDEPFEIGEVSLSRAKKAIESTLATRARGISEGNIHSLSNFLYDASEALDYEWHHITTHDSRKEKLIGFIAPSRFSSVKSAQMFISHLESMVKTYKKEILKKSDT